MRAVSNWRMPKRQVATASSLVAGKTRRREPSRMVTIQPGGSLIRSMVASWSNATSACPKAEITGSAAVAVLTAKRLPSVSNKTPSWSAGARPSFGARLPTSHATCAGLTGNSTPASVSKRSAPFRSWAAMVSPLRRCSRVRKSRPSAPASSSTVMVTAPYSLVAISGPPESEPVIRSASERPTPTSDLVAVSSTPACSSNAAMTGKRGGASASSPALCPAPERKLITIALNAVGITGLTSWPFHSGLIISAIWSGCRPGRCST